MNKYDFSRERITIEAENEKEAWEKLEWELAKFTETMKLDNEVNNWCVLGIK